VAFELGLEIVRCGFFLAVSDEVNYNKWMWRERQRKHRFT
jgi:hypothetical protein